MRPNVKTHLKVVNLYKLYENFVASQMARGAFWLRLPKHFAVRTRLCSESAYFLNPNQKVEFPKVL